jgi:hypothetical protein
VGQVFEIVEDRRGAPVLKVLVCYHQHAKREKVSHHHCPVLEPGLNTTIMSGTSRDYIIGRLRREKLDHLADAVECGEVSAYAIACELGWQKRKVLGTGSENQAKRRAFALHRVFGRYGST